MPYFDEHESTAKPTSSTSPNPATNTVPEFQAMKSDKGSKNGYSAVTTTMPEPLAVAQADPHITNAYVQFMHRLTFKYQICENPEDLPISEIASLMGMIPGNTTQIGLDLRKWCYYASMPLCCIPYCLYYANSAKFRVAENHFVLVEDRSSQRPETKIYGPGYHFLGPYRYVQGEYSLRNKVANNLIQSKLGDLTIITVDQGTIALFEYNGQYKILGPGLHVIRDTMQFEQTVRLDKFYIRVGPEKWLTIPDQYDGIALDNGQTVILRGGRQYHLPHENYKFAKLVPKIILTDRIVTDVPKYIKNINKTYGELPVLSGTFDTSYYLQTKTKDGSILYLDAMLFWCIQDTELAAQRAMNIMELRSETTEDFEDETVHIARASRNIDNLRKTVLRYAKSCLAETVGQCCLTDEDKFLTSQVSSSTKLVDAVQEAENAVVTLNFAIQNFLNKKARDLTTMLNNELKEYGVHVSKITINDALPMEDVQRQLDMQTKARIDRNTELVEAETKRQVAEEFMRTDKIQRIGEANNKLEAARIAKQTAITEAEAVAEKERIIAQARKEAAELQESTALGKQLAAIAAVGAASGQFNQGAGDKVYIVGSPLEAMSRTVGAAVPGLMNALSGQLA